VAPPRFPEDIRDRLARRLARARADWLAGGGDWPLELPLGDAVEADALHRPEALRAWVDAWRTWHGPGEVTWRERRWPAAGTQRLPWRIALPDAAVVAELLGEGDRWARAVARHAALAGRWPRLGTALARRFDVLADYPDDDVDRLAALLAWLEANPASGLYPRQLPVPGVDSKWYGAHAGLVAELLAALRGDAGETGLRGLPVPVRMRLLDPALRAQAGGLGDIAAPAEDWATLALPARYVFIVENLQTGLAFEDLPGAVVVMARGYALDPLAAIPWVADARCFYWGDLDTHGFAMLDRARAMLPGLTSLLMDEPTLLAHRALWGSEATPHAAATLPRLTPEEQAVYEGLRNHRWGLRLRLEQERIQWPLARDVIRATAPGASPPGPP